MPDIKKVIKGLELCSNILGCVNTTNTDCPYSLGDGACQYEDLLTDALTIVREQEPVKPNYDPYYQEWFCGNCGETIARVYNFCNYCGRKVQWDD